MFNDSSLPQFTSLTMNKLETVELNDDEIAMIVICGESLILPLKLFLEALLKLAFFPTLGKKQLNRSCFH